MVDAVTTLIAQCLTDGSNYQITGIRKHIHLQESWCVQRCQTASTRYVLVHPYEHLSA
jgi:hypothetical protein